MNGEPDPRSAPDPDATVESTELRARAALDAETTEITFGLRVVEGPDAGTTAGLTLGGEGPGRAVLGTGPACELRLGGRQVSRRHVAFELAGASVIVTDLGSKNGTWVGGVRIREAELRGGEQLLIGGNTILLERGPRLPAALSPEVKFGRLLGASREMRRLFPLLARLAATNLPVLVQGEAGTGKEVLAEALHAEGPRRERPFVVLDCTAVPPPLQELELFGQEPDGHGGAARPGALEQAAGGTLVLDEVAELAPAVQAKLLKVLGRGELRRAAFPGNPAPAERVVVDARLVATSRRDLDREVAAGRFREDLFFALGVARVELPPLRKRADDVPLLAAHFAAELGADPATLPRPALDAWRDAPWPGNVRELQNQVARQVALGDLAALAAPPPSTAPAAPSPSPAPSTGDGDWLDAILAERLTLVEARERVNAVFERRYLEHMLAVAGGNVVRAAARAGIARRYFQILKAKRIP